MPRKDLFFSCSSIPDPVSFEVARAINMSSLAASSSGELKATGESIQKKTRQKYEFG